MNKILSFIFIIFAFNFSGIAQELTSGLRGNPDAIKEANEMVETMGGKEIWAQLKSVHFVHEWFPWYRTDSYIENEILDLTGSRSWVKMESEIYHRVRAYSPEYKQWSIENGEFSYSSDERWNNSMERAPYHFCRIAKAIAMGDSNYEVKFGEGDIPYSKRLEFYGPDGVMHGFNIRISRLWFDYGVSV